MKVSASSIPQTNGGLAIGVGGGREWALFGIRIAALGETVGGRQPRPEATASFGIEVRSQERAGAGEGATCDISVFGEAGRSWTGTRAGEDVIRIMFEQQPLLDGRQLVHCLLDTFSSTITATTQRHCFSRSRPVIIIIIMRFVACKASLDYKYTTLWWVASDNH